MSNTKKKVGRPKGVKNKPKVDTITKEPIGDYVPDPTVEAVKDILKEAETKSQAILASEPDVSGVSPTTDASTDPGQADYIPGTRPPDLTYLPDTVYDEHRRISRPCARKNEYHYCFVEAGKINQFKVNGYRFCLYDGGQGSGLAPGGLGGTYLFERTLDNHVRHGDTFLMYLPMRAYEALSAEMRKKLDAWNMAAETDFMNEGYRRGVRTFKEVDGVQISN